MIIKKDSGLIYTILLFLGIFNSSFCQNSNDTIAYKRLTKFALASVDYTLYSPSKYTKDNEASEIGMNEYKAKIQFALKLKEKKTYLLNKIQITKFDAYANRGKSQNFNKSYYSFSYSIGIILLMQFNQARNWINLDIPE